MHLLVGTDQTREVGQVRCPTLSLGMSIDTPTYRPAQNAIDVLTKYLPWAEGHGVKPTIGVFDALYPSLKAEDFHAPSEAWESG